MKSRSYFPQTELLSRTTYFSDRQDLAGAPPGSLLVMYVENDEMTALQRSGQWALAEIINDVDQRPAAAILRRVGP